MATVGNSTIRIINVLSPVELEKLMHLKPCPIKFGPTRHQERVSAAARKRASAATDRAATLFSRGEVELMEFWLDVRERYLALACRTRSGARRSPR